MKYEVVITSGNSNQAPIGAFFKGDFVTLHLYGGSHTFENLQKDGFYILNTCSPYLIAKSVLDDAGDYEYLDKNGIKIPYLKDSYKIELIEIKSRKIVETKNEFGSSKLMIVEGKPIFEKILNCNTSAYNRADGAVVEMAVLYSRKNMISKEEMNDEITRLMKIIKKVGSKNHIELAKKLGV
ncbi:DUF447 domain-containing protein [Methanococcus maripaludis]|jgi:hypothetical protein|uniref:DUF447 family protein n=1 Tax=Methanococcus maripaludis TaxID=39152 RepID=A0A7J9NMZ9_METMI|nr:DUF447 domain-containing protein [Methanococcus maripaludis]MBA2846128.1 hypothetical protein [Methanococcus maripaludis]MBM7410070.1 hypothetical protein [Methanococcus maripaludis]MBP2219400.1 hypothetical protein [Methanococcus maripaludis]